MTFLKRRPHFVHAPCIAGVGDGLFEDVAGGQHPVPGDGRFTGLLVTGARRVLRPERLHNVGAPPGQSQIFFSLSDGYGIFGVLFLQGLSQ